MGDTAAFVQHNVLLKTALSPQDLHAPLECVRSQLSKMLLKYSDELKGVPVTFGDIELPPGKDYGRILGEVPWVHVDVCTKILVFQPAVGLVLRGRVNKLSDGYISLLVFGMFNANISADEMYKKCTFNDSSGFWEWMPGFAPAMSAASSDNSNGNGNGGLMEGDLVSCRVLHFQQANGVLSLVCGLA